MEKIVFTNGCFDVLHPGHIDLLKRAKALGTRLIVGINSDASVKSIKGPERPIFSQNERKAMLEALGAVDEVLIYDELTPEELIHDIKPDVLVKGGDWATNEIIGADFVIGSGGEVHSLPIYEDYSTSALLQRIAPRPAESNSGAESISATALIEHAEVLDKVSSQLKDQIRECADLILGTFRSGNKILICGNGGSAADAQHLAAEFVGRYEKEREGLPAIALTTDTSALTALANDYDFDKVFARQVEALARTGDCLIAISTSGNSPNVIAAAMAARSVGCRVIAMTGAAGKKLASLSDAAIMIPSERTARIQEAHITIAHIWCEIVESEI
jgi:D-sedoheptulose 7-phosphate isomerase